jgi:hypothetical protein
MQLLLLQVLLIFCFLFCFVLFCLRTRTMFINIVVGTRIALLHAGPPPSSMSSRF